MAKHFKKYQLADTLYFFQSIFNIHSVLLCWIFQSCSAYLAELIVDLH